MQKSNVVIVSKQLCVFESAWLYVFKRKTCPLTGKRFVADVLRTDISVALEAVNMMQPTMICYVPSTTDKHHTQIEGRIEHETAFFMN